jgi:selT/selW/selH-like putative selenoprotein
LAAEIQQATGMRPELIEGSGGVFEIEANGKLIFSKKRLDRFPRENEIVQLLQNGS